MNTLLLTLPVVIVTVSAVIAYVWVSLATSAIFKKTGSAGWKAWVPLVREWELFRLASMNPIWIILAYTGMVILAIVGFLVVRTSLANGDESGIVGMVFALIAFGFLAFLLLVTAMILVIRFAIRMNTNFGVSAGYTVLAVLVWPVWLSILGWGSAVWRPTQQAQQQPVSMVPAPPVPPPSPFEMQVPVMQTPPVVPHSQPYAQQPQPYAQQPQAYQPPAPVTPTSYPPQEPQASIDQDPTLPPAPVEGPSHESPAALETPAVWAPPPPPQATQSPAPQSPLVPEPEVETEPEAVLDAIDEHTVLASRRRHQAVLVLPNGETVDLTEDTVFIGRSPVAPVDTPGAQLIAVDEPTRTISKTHARLDRDGSAWVIHDLESTNGVFLVDSNGAETGVTTSAPLVGTFMLGDATFEMRL